MKKLPYVLISLVLCMIMSISCIKSAEAFWFFPTQYDKSQDTKITKNETDIAQIESRVAENRLGTGSENTTAPYGYNDYIPENGFKNYIHNEGYSKIYDYKPNNVNTTAVGYYGKAGNPDSYDVDYVLTEEYNKYSSQMQDVRIDINKNNIDINKVNIRTNKKAIAKEVIQRVKADKKLNKRVTTVDKSSRRRDKILNKKIIKNVGNILINKNNITDNSNRINSNLYTLQNHEGRISTNEGNISNNTSRIAGLENKVDELEETAVGIHAEVDLYDSRYFKIGAYATSDIRHGRLDSVMGKITLKPFKSYELKRLERLEKQLAMYIDMDECNSLEYKELELIETRNPDGTITISTKK